MSKPNYAEISPRMRRLVRLLRGWGYETTDSGDRRIQLGLCDVLDVADALDPDTRQRLLAAARTISEAAHELRAPKD